MQAGQEAGQEAGHRLLRPQARRAGAGQDEIQEILGSQKNLLRVDTGDACLSHGQDMRAPYQESLLSATVGCASSSPLPEPHGLLARSNNSQQHALLAVESGIFLHACVCVSCVSVCARASVRVRRVVLVSVLVPVVEGMRERVVVSIRSSTQHADLMCDWGMAGGRGGMAGMDAAAAVVTLLEAMHVIAHPERKALQARQLSAAGRLRPTKKIEETVGPEGKTSDRAEREALDDIASAVSVLEACVLQLMLLPLLPPLPAATAQTHSFMPLASLRQVVELVPCPPCLTAGPLSCLPLVCSPALLRSFPHVTRRSAECNLKPGIRSVPGTRLCSIRTQVTQAAAEARDIAPVVTRIDSNHVDSNARQQWDDGRDFKTRPGSPTVYFHRITRARVVTMLGELVLGISERGVITARRCKALQGKP